MEYLEKKRAQGQATEQKLIDAALTLMRQRGYDAVSIRDICRQAGATTGAFYHHFRSKEEMLERGGRQLDLYIQKQLEIKPFHSSLSALRIIFTAYAEYMEQNQGELTARYYQNMLAVSARRFTKRCGATWSRGGKKAFWRIPIRPKRQALSACAIFEASSSIGRYTIMIFPWPKPWNENSKCSIVFSKAAKRR